MPRRAASPTARSSPIDKPLGPRACCASHLSDAVRPGEAFAPMHWTAQVSRAGRINAAVNPAVDPISGQPELKHTPVEIRRTRRAVAWHDSRSPSDDVAANRLLDAHHRRGLPRLSRCRRAAACRGAARRCRRRCARANPGPWLEGDAGRRRRDRRRPARSRDGDGRVTSTSGARSSRAVHGDRSPQRRPAQRAVAGR